MTIILDDGVRIYWPWSQPFLVFPFDCKIKWDSDNSSVFIPNYVIDKGLEEYAEEIGIKLDKENIEDIKYALDDSLTVRVDGATSKDRLPYPLNWDDELSF